MSKKDILKWTLTTILVLVGVFILIRLGFWQLDRLQSRRQFNEHYLEQISSPAIQLNEFTNELELITMEYRSINVTGKYDFKNEIYLKNQAWNNLPGYRVVTPLFVDNSDNVVLVERGWIALEDLAEIESINKPYDQHQKISGIIRLPQSKNDFGGTSNQTDNAKSNFYLYVDLDLLKLKMEYDLLPIYIQLYSENLDQKPYSQITEIEITEGPHMGYALQWFFFASLLGIGYPFFVRKQIQGEKNQEQGMNAINIDRTGERKSGKNNITILLLVSSFLMIGLGILLSSTGSASMCNQFPLCFSQSGFSFDILLINAHRLFTLATGMIITFLTITTWRKYRENKNMLLSVTISFIVFIGQILIGGFQATKNLPANLLFVHSTGSVIYLLSIVYAFYSEKYVRDAVVVETKTIFNDPQRRKDFLILNKPIIVSLLLVTTYAGMVVGGEKIPSLALTFWTMVGGALAAGGASAINQYIDRKIDLSMQRTAKRPLPAGRLHPTEALALGISEIILSFYIFAAYVNLNAALLAMLGMVYYVFIYSSWLKHITVQNIVIGGGAGAIPPLVGWAAATGGLNIPSLLLFALVFLWTPPHFWALALVRKNDYARASIPMLPVVKGEKNTRLQILIYTIQLVLLTLLMPLFGIGGSVYFMLAVILGLWLLSTAWQVYKKEGNKIAFKMYRYSSMYLAFIFFALVVDVLI